jgi:hypothetical protein
MVLPEDRVPSQRIVFMAKQPIRPRLPTRFITPLAVLRCSGGVMSGSRERKGVSAARSVKYMHAESRATAPKACT